MKSFKSDVGSISPSSEQMMKGKRSKYQPRNSLQWPSYVINSIDNTKLLCLQLLNMHLLDYPSIV